MVSRKRLPKVVRFVVFLVTLIMFHSLSAFAGTVVVKPGQFDHFILQVPDRLVAGENFIIKVYAYDANKNLITNFSETGKEFKVDVTGAGTVQPPVIGASSFSGGVANVLVNNKKAERFTFSIRESGGTVPVIARELSVAPNKLDHFVLQSPRAVTAGVNFDLKVIAKDVFDNTVDDLDIGRNIKITTTGTSSVKTVGNATLDFRNGTASASFMSEKAGEVVIAIQEVSSGSSGRTQGISVSPSSLSYFKLQSPKTAVAGESFELLIAAYDAFDNVVTNYSAHGSGVRLSTTGSSKIEPSFVSPAEFKNGEVLVKSVYERAEEIQVVARESNREQIGRTGDIKVANAAPDHFVVVTPDAAVAGQKFKIKIETYDRFNNIVKNFNLAGNDVLLNTTGSGSISPARISPAEFTNGIAMIDVLYDKAESFLISARMSSDKVAGRVQLREQDVKREERPVARTEPRELPLEKPKPPVERGVEKPAAAARADAKPKDPEPKPKVAEAKPKEPEPRPKKAVEAKPKEPERTPETTAAKPKAEAEKKPVKEEKKTPPMETRKPVEKAAVQPDAVIAKKPAEERRPPPLIPETKKAEEPKKKEERPAVKDDLFVVNNVSIIEAKNKAMLVINIKNPDGHLEYGDEIESRYGKEWLKIRMKPAVNKTEKSFKFSSAFVGEVQLEEDKKGGGGLSVFIELIPPGLTYDIARVKNTLIVTLAAP